MTRSPPPSPDEVVTMVACSDCGHMLPESNLAIHQATACGGRARAAAASQDTPPRPPRNSSSQNSAAATPAAAARMPRRHSAPATPRTPPQQNRKTDDDHDVIDLSEEPSTPTEWPCPRCTLLNPMSSTMCSACQYTKERPADAVRRERLINSSSFGEMPSSPASLVGGGALLGSVLGAAGAYMGGRPVSSGAFEGAMSGAIGGSVLDTVLRSSPSVASARTSAASGMPSYPSSNDYNNGRRRSSQQQPRPSFRVSHNNNGMSMTTTVIRSPDGSVRTYRRQGGGTADPFMGMLMANAMMQNRQPNIDGMSYEQLLEAFGDGNENRGADQHDIDSLPVSTVHGKLPEDQDKNQCAICLEKFEEGQERKTLPCLHGFHPKCVDTWLRTSASCPICKHNISS